MTIIVDNVSGNRPSLMRLPQDLLLMLFVGIQQENSAIRSLQHENDELRQSLTDHQSALELIMTKYRHQMVQFMNKKK